ncbi:MAG: type II toxin-antitoxin system RelB/DinJ family antitoxin [Faecousia sp.]
MNTPEHNTVTAPKTATFQMRINPEVKQRAETIFASYGLTLTDAVNIFIQQSLNTEGLPFLLSPENGAYLRAKAVSRLMEAVQKGWDSVKTDEDWVPEEEAYRLLEGQV